jgi:ParB family chromosome partitioning protein
MDILIIENIQGGNAMSESKQIPIEKLIDFGEHIFKPYDDERLQNLVDSVKESGVLTPLIVRPADEGKFEILAGHNRRNAAVKAGLTEVPAVIMSGVSDEEARLIVTETNLLQRSFHDLALSERTKSLIMLYEAAKQQGKRTDLLSKLEKKLNARPGRPSKESTFGQNGERYDAAKEVGTLFGIDARTLSRYFKLKDLSDSLFEHLDNKKIPFIAAVDLAFIHKSSQDKVAKYLTDSDSSLSVAQAKELRHIAEANGGKLTADTIKQALTERPPAPKSVAAIRLGTKTLSEFFSPEQSQEDIEAEIVAALKAYRGIAD